MVAAFFLFSQTSLCLVMLNISGSNKGKIK